MTTLKKDRRGYDKGPVGQDAPGDKHGLFGPNRGPGHGTKPAGRGAPPMTTNPAGDFGVPNIPTAIYRYGPDSMATNYPASRVATGRIPPTGAGMTRYTATVDGTSHSPSIDCAGKWEHNEPGQTYPNKAVAKSGPSQTPKQVRLTRTGKKTGD